jgi:hypothetical protein
MILTPGQIEQVGESTYGPDLYSVDLSDTLAAYADIVQKVAEMDGSGVLNEYWDCNFCGNTFGDDRQYHMVGFHDPECAYASARKLRGMDG